MRDGEFSQLTALPTAAPAAAAATTRATTAAAPKATIFNAALLLTPHLWRCCSSSQTTPLPTATTAAPTAAAAAATADASAALQSRICDVALLFQSSSLEVMLQ
jgi:hypothetical protein